METSSSHFIESLAINGVKLRLSFHFEQDRFAHQLRLVRSDATEVCLLQSVEGPADAYWPQSPPFQNLSIEPINEQEVALLTGMSGKGHWSASMSPLGDRLGLEFDIAVQSSESAESVGSTYAFEESLSVRRNLEATHESNVGQLEFREIAYSIAEQDGSSLEVQMESLLGSIHIAEDCDQPKNASQAVFRPDASAEEASTTIRWKYSIEIVA